MANNEDIQNGFLIEIEPLLRNSDYYIAQKGYIKIPKYDEDSLAKWKVLEDKYSYLLIKADPVTEERWVRDYLKNKIEYLEVLQNFSKHIKDYQESMGLSSGVNISISCLFSSISCSSSLDWAHSRVISLLSHLVLAASLPLVRFLPSSCSRSSLCSHSPVSRSPFFVLRPRCSRLLP